MNLGQYPEVARLVPEKRHEKGVCVNNINCHGPNKSYNKAIDSLTPLLSLEVGFNVDKSVKAMDKRAKELCFGWWNLLPEDTKKSFIYTLASSNVIEIRKV